MVEGLRLSIQNNRDIAMRELLSFNGVKTGRPDGTFYVLPDFRAYNGNSVELSKVSAQAGVGRHRARTGVRHGRAPAAQFRGQREGCDRGIARMKWALDPTSPNDIYIGDKKLIRDWL